MSILPVWSFNAVAAALCAALQTREQALRAEQAVYGLDALSELELHALLADGLATSGWGVLREQAYPHEWMLKRTGDASLPERRDRQRCDIVLTDRTGCVLDDAVHTEKQRRAARAAIEGTLFAALAPAEPVRPANLVPPEEALWIELKVIAQHALVAGALTPNRSYASLLTRGPITDLVKLNADDRIRSAASAIVLFAQSEDTAHHDLNVLTHRCLDKGLAISSPQITGLAISDRIGNAWCALCFIGLRK